MKIDEIDIKILSVLQADGRLSNQELAERVSLSPSACHRRVKLLEEEKFIKGYQAMLSAEKLGFMIEAFVKVNIAQLSDDEHRYISKEIEAMDEVINAYIVTGEANYLLYVRTRDFEAFSQFVVNRLNRLKGVTKIYSEIVLGQVKSCDHFIALK